MKRVWTPFPLLESLRTHNGRHWNHFPAKMHQIAGFCIHSFTIFFGVISADYLQKWCLYPDTNFRLARQRSHRCCFMKRPLIVSGSNSGENLCEHYKLSMCMRVFTSWVENCSSDGTAIHAYSRCSDTVRHTVLQCFDLYLHLICHSCSLSSVDEFRPV